MQKETFIGQPRLLTYVNSEKTMNIAYIRKRLASADIFPTEINEVSKNVISIDLTGDWKHTHNYCDYLMAKMRYRLIKEEVQPSCEDWYTSTHFYIKSLMKR